MARIQPISYEESTGKVKELLTGVKQALGMTPNMMKTMAQSPAVLEAYLNFSATLGGGSLDAKLREQIALVSAEVNGCGYCAAAHTAIGKMIDLGEDEILAARKGHSIDARANAALQFARNVIVNRGEISDADLQAVKDVEFSDGEISEILATVALNIFTNYFNLIARTDIDFPKVQIRAA
ncbi:MAG TPA: carboxymuconolactone decarboxylase family protein [Pyrinomonadaceae bacterium]|nr:carboxymuconolactone decarboxylase family protein [Pyrinomonadaceae bacterium]